MKPSDVIRQMCVDRLARGGIGEIDGADHETCMLARWDALLEWLDSNTSDGVLDVIDSDLDGTKRRECERNAINRVVVLRPTNSWRVRGVDHEASTADLVETVHPDELPCELWNVPIADVLEKLGCSCGQHLVAPQGPAPTDAVGQKRIGTLSVLRPKGSR